MHMLEICGHHVVIMLRSEDVAVAKMAMLLIYDMVSFGEVSIEILCHMLMQYPNCVESYTHRNCKAITIKQVNFAGNLISWISWKVQIRKIKFATKL